MTYMNPTKERIESTCGCILIRYSDQLPEPDRDFVTSCQRHCICPLNVHPFGVFIERDARADDCKKRAPNETTTEDYSKYARPCMNCRQRVHWHATHWVHTDAYLSTPRMTTGGCRYPTPDYEDEND